MTSYCSARLGPSSSHPGRSSFSLIELIVVMVIISVLVAILLPAMTKARDHARSGKSKADLKALGDALEIYRNDNESDSSGRQTHGYPPSAEADDPAVSGTDKISGAHWLVRHLMGKDQMGYAPRRNVPADMLHPGLPDEEVTWYDYEPGGGPKVGRVGPYIPSGTLKVMPTRELPQSDTNPALNRDYEQPVFVDAFGYPVLYCVGNAVEASKRVPCLASFDGSKPGIYTFKDNGMFTGLCGGSPGSPGARVYDGWDFGFGSQHKIGYFGLDDPPKPETAGADAQTFVYYILNKEIYNATNDPATPATKPTAVPYRPETFLLFTPGRDGIFGSPDDVRNF